MQTETFEKVYNSLSEKEIYRVDKIKGELRINPYVGKPVGYKYFREKRLDGFRV